MAKHTPVDYLLKHESIVLSAYRKNDKRPKKTWEDLVKQLPELPGIMSVATFRQYITVFGTIIDTLDKVRQDNGKIRQRANALEVENSSLKNELKGKQQELDKVRQELKTLDQRPVQSTGGPPSMEQSSSPLPKRLAGWNLRRSKDGYLRCYRKINAKLHSIYLGRTFDPDKAERLIVEKEKKIKLDMS